MRMEQFLKLQQGDQSVMEYLGRFNQLSQCAPEYVSTDVNKKHWIVRGLNTKLQVMLADFTTASYNEIVSIAISVGEKNRLHQEKKRKNVPAESSGGNIQCSRIIYHPVHHSHYYL